MGRSGPNGEARNILLLPGIELRLLGRSARSLVTIPTEISRLEKLDIEGLIIFKRGVKKVRLDCVDCITCILTQDMVPWLYIVIVCHEVPIK
jgi:hypothetical protein